MAFPPIHPALDRALSERGYLEPTPVQSAVLEAGPEVDLLVSAQTGSGKTVAFGLALASTLLGEALAFGPAGAPLGLIIAPTRELALQISRELSWLYAPTGARIVECVGGMDIRREQRLLGAGAHIVVGTPGRLRDHLNRAQLDLSCLRAAVLDEADEMLDLGFRDELEAILDQTPPARRTLLFSATIARGIAALASRYQRDAVRIDTTDRDAPHGDIEYRAMRVAPHDIERAVVNVLRMFEAPRTLVFCHTREAVRHMHASLRERGFSVVGLSGEMSQRERNEALQALRDGRCRVCVATDVAARGLDLPDLGLVIHADPPADKASLLHRSGRTGRAGRKGVSVVLATASKRRRCEQIFASANIIAPWSAPPSAEEIRAEDRLRLLNDPLFSETPAEEDLALARQLLAKIAPEVIAAGLLKLRRAEHPAPEDLSADVVGARSPIAPRGQRAEFSNDRADRTGQASVPADAWFRLNVGRRKNAEPRWIVPFICRVGGVVKNDIGPIRIFEDETKFAILGDKLADFAAAARATLENDIEITPTSPPRARSSEADPASVRRAPRAAAPEAHPGANRPGLRRPNGERDALNELAPPSEPKRTEASPSTASPPPKRRDAGPGLRQRDRKKLAKQAALAALSEPRASERRGERREPPAFDARAKGPAGRAAEAKHRPNRPQAKDRSPTDKSWAFSRSPVRTERGQDPAARSDETRAGVRPAGAKRKEKKRRP